MIITKIQKNRGKRAIYNVYIDDNKCLQVGELNLSLYRLHKGDEIKSETIDKIISAEQRIEAKNIAINFLSYRKRSIKEVVDHLKKKGFNQECISNVIKDLQALKFLNDIEFAHAFIRDKRIKKPVGRLLIKLQLLSKGIKSADADKIIDEEINESSEVECAAKALNKKLKSYSKNIDNKMLYQKRLLDYLLRRGFSYDIASRTLKENIGVKNEDI